MRAQTIEAALASAAGREDVKRFLEKVLKRSLERASIRLRASTRRPRLVVESFFSFERTCKADVEQIVSRLARRYSVSPQAMRIRPSSLGLLNAAAPVMPSPGRVPL